MPKSYRIRTQPGVDKSIQIKLDQDFEFLEILSLKILQSDIYTRLCSDYGVVVGRVLTNGGFGMPNVKVSVFIPISEEDQLDPIISELYPYINLDDLNVDGYRYNLLPYKPSYTGHAATGTFPEREDVLTNAAIVEVYDKYYKFTTKTNQSGDYMFFGVPTGEQTIIMDVDLSDIGCFSLTPQDLINLNLAGEGQFDGNKFKSSTNLRELPQLITLNKTISVQPLWGEPEVCLLGITRVDFDLTASSNINIQPTAVFMGSVMSTSNEDFVKRNCKPKINTGNLCDLVSGPGQILAIRQTINVDSNGNPILEKFNLEQDGKVIDENGTWLINVPMNIDYVTTNEFGEQILSNDPKIGVPTKGKYRFKVKWQNEEGLQNNTQRGHFLVPNIKEYGWSNNTQTNDPFDPDSALGFTFTIPVGTLSGSPTTLTVASSGGLVLKNLINTQSFYVLINGNLYTGSVESIPYTIGDTIQVIANDTSDITQPISIIYDFLPQNYFDVLRSYAFSLDWDDYANKQSAIDCEDTFYQFNYNKVYTVSSFIDRYKNGQGRARHLGIKEITDRACQSENNKLPVNDIQRNFDFLAFAVNLILNVLTFPLIGILSAMHVIQLLWPVLKWVFGIGVPAIFALNAFWSIYNGVQALINYPPAVALSIGLFLSGDAYIAAATLFAFYVSPALIKWDGFNKFALPMLSYPDCEACPCEGVSDGIEEITGTINQNPGVSNTSFLADTNTSNLFYVDNNNPFYSDIQTNFPDNLANAQNEYLTIFGGIESNDGDWKEKAPRSFYTYTFPSGTDWKGYPLTETLSQKLNSFNLRDKFFNNINVIKTKINGSNDIYDQVFVTLVDPNIQQSIISGDILTFQNPSLSGDLNRITGLTTTNQYDNNAITGITSQGNISTTIICGDPSDPTMVNNLPPVPVTLIVNQDNSYYGYPADMEYFQCITGMTVGDYLNQSIGGDFKNDYLKHIVEYAYVTFAGTTPVENVGSEIAIEKFSNYQDLGLIFFVRGVDPNTQKQTISYDLSKIFGQGWNQTVITGSFKPNYPIRGYSNGTTPIRHDASNNTLDPAFDNLLYPSFTFTPDLTLFNAYPSLGSTLPYYYLCTDKTYINSSGYAPIGTYPGMSSLLNIDNTINTLTNSYTKLLPTNLPLNSYYVGGGSFIYTNSIPDWVNGVPSGYHNDQYWGVYSPSYYPYFTSGILGSIDFNNNYKIVMRSDRLPTSTNTDVVGGGGNVATSFALHQNNNFVYYRVPDEGFVDFQNIISIQPDIPTGVSNDSEINTTLLDSLTCEKMTTLKCYTGYGTGFTVIEDCENNPNQKYLKNGCYYLLNKKYVKQLPDDIALFLEWKTRFIIAFSACRGVFGHMFQNNWINGVLYMPSFNKQTTFDIFAQPKYNYCKDIVIYNDISNNFFYRSSPWDGDYFVGAPKPVTTNVFGNLFTDDSANERQILFPTTITDLGNRDEFISEICANPTFGGKYLTNTLKSTSYNDGSDILQLSIISRLVNSNWQQQLLMFSGSSASIAQFFSRSGERIDGDIAQSFSINSEYQINPFITGNYNDNQIWVNQDSVTSSPVFGVFYDLGQTETPYKNRRALSPGITIYNITPPVLLQNIYGYPETQEVPLYKWKTESNTSIFGNENNNWYTNSNTNSNGQGFFSKKYQNLDATTDPYFKTSLNTPFLPNVSYGFITNYDSAGNPIPIGNPISNPFLVGAPNYFYFGLKNGKTALNRFIKIYIDTTAD